MKFRKLTFLKKHKRLLVFIRFLCGYHTIFLLDFNISLINFRVSNLVLGKPGSLAPIVKPREETLVHWLHIIQPGR